MSYPAPHYSKVFISYSHDSTEHITRILQLSNRLRADGIDSYVDQYEMSPPEGWARWALHKIEEADFVIVVCTETYYRRLLGKEDKGKGKGVKWEGVVIYQELYEQEIKNTKFIPVFFSALDSAYLPISLRSTTSYDLSTEEGYEALYRRLTNQPLVLMAELGKLKPMPPVEGKQAFPISERISISTQEHASSRGITSNEASAFAVNEKHDSITQYRRNRVGIWSAALLIVTLIAAIGWELIPPKEIPVFSPKKPEIILQQKITTPSQVYNVALSQDGEIAASADINGVVCLWNVSQANLLKEMEKVDLSVPTRCVAISSNLVAAGDGKGKIWLWQISDGHSLGSLKGHTDYVFRIHFSADGQKILSGGVDDGNISSVQMWNLSDRKRVTKLRMMESADNIIAVSPNLQLVAVHSSRTKKAWLRSLSDEKQLNNLEGPEFVVGGGAFSPDAKVLALGSEDGTVRLWRVGDGKLLNELRGKNNKVQRIAFHPNEQIIAAGYRDGTICLWNMDEKTPFSLLNAHEGRVNAIVFSENGQILASASEDKTIRFWRIEAQK